MKSSTLHRSGLTRERMAMLENTRIVTFDKSEIPQYGKTTQNVKVQPGTRNPDLDVLYKGIDKTIAKATSAQLNKTPGAYLGIGFAAGLIVMFIIALIVALVSNDTRVQAPSKSVTVVAADKFPQETPVVTEEKYVVKSGDTLDKIAFRFYGKYDMEKIKQIQVLNNISNPSALQIGQVIIVPVNK